MKSWKLLQFSTSEERVRSKNVGKLWQVDTTRIMKCIIRLLPGAQTARVFVKLYIFISEFP